MFDKPKQRFKDNVDEGKARGELLAEMWKDDRGQAGVGNMARVAISLIVALTVGGLVAAFLLPVGIDEIVGVDTSSWSSGATSMWDILDVVIVLAVMLFFFAVALSATDMID